MNRREILFPVFGVLMLVVSNGLAAQRRYQDEICLTIQELQHIIEESTSGIRIWTTEPIDSIVVPSGKLVYPNPERGGRVWLKRNSDDNDYAKEINIGSRSLNENENKNVNANRVVDYDDDDLDSQFGNDFRNYANKKRLPTISRKPTIPRRLLHDYLLNKNLNKNTNINTNTINSERSQRTNNQSKYNSYGMPIGSRSLGTSRNTNQDNNVNENVNSNVNVNRWFNDDLV